MITLSLTCHPVAFTKLRLALRFPRAKQAGRASEPVPEEYIEEEKESQDFGVKAD